MNIDLTTIDTHTLVAELRGRDLAVIIWQPEDLEGYGDPAVPLEERLGEVADTLEDRSIEYGWEIIHELLGYNDAETRYEDQNR